MYARKSGGLSMPCLLLLVQGAAPKKETNPLYEKRPKTFGEQRVSSTNRQYRALQPPLPTSSHSTAAQCDQSFRGRCEGCDAGISPDL